MKEQKNYSPGPKIAEEEQVMLEDVIHFMTSDRSLSGVDLRVNRAEVDWLMLLKSSGKTAFSMA